MPLVRLVLPRQLRAESGPATSLRKLSNRGRHPRSRLLAYVGSTTFPTSRSSSRARSTKFARLTTGSSDGSGSSSPMPRGPRDGSRVRHRNSPERSVRYCSKQRGLGGQVFEPDTEAEYRTYPQCGADCSLEPFEMDEGMRISFVCPEHGVHTVIDPFVGSPQHRLRYTGRFICCGSATSSRWDAQLGEDTPRRAPTRLRQRREGSHRIGHQLRVPQSKMLNLY